MLPLRLAVMRGPRMREKSVSLLVLICVEIGKVEIREIDSACCGSGRLGSCGDACSRYTSHTTLAT